MEFIMRTNTVAGVIFGLLMIVFVAPSHAAKIIIEPNHLQNLQNRSNLNQTRGQLPTLKVPPIKDATSCRGWDCSIEGQICPQGVPGASEGDYQCTNSRWVLESKNTGGSAETSGDSQQIESLIAEKESLQAQLEQAKAGQEELNNLRGELEQAKAGQQELEQLRNEHEQLQNKYGELEAKYNEQTSLHYGCDNPYDCARMDERNAMLPRQSAPRYNEKHDELMRREDDERRKSQPQVDEFAEKRQECEHAYKREKQYFGLEDKNNVWIWNCTRGHVQPSKFPERDTRNDHIYEKQRQRCLAGEVSMCSGV
jgi:hypothetical protein